MTRHEFNLGMAALLSAFAYAQDKTTAQSEDIYFEMLKDIPVQIWNEGIKKCLRESTYFPTIHDIGVACFGETKEHMEDRCDPLRFKQNYQVRIEAVSWQENMAKALNPPAPQIEHKPTPRIEHKSSVPKMKRYPDGTTDHSRAVLAQIWKGQDERGFVAINTPEWYRKKMEGQAG